MTKTLHQVGNPVKNKGKNGKVGTITAVKGRAKYAVTWAGQDAESDTEYANLVVASPPRHR